MSDRFKFRAWNLTGRYMVYSNARHPYGGCESMLRGYNEKDLIFEDVCEESAGWEVVEIGDDWIVMQCTGLKDKNGNLIYEGDVVQMPLLDNKDYAITVVEWSRGGFVSSETGHPIYLNSVSDDRSPRPHNTWEVIGNIYQNPELLIKPLTKPNEERVAEIKTRFTCITDNMEYTHTYMPCKHKNWWAFTAKIWIFEKKYVWCDDCHSAIPRKKLPTPSNKLT